MVQNPKAGRCQGTCLLITASLSEHIFLCLSDICSRCFNNVILEKEDNRTVGCCNADLCQGAIRLPVITMQTGFGADHGTHAETTLKNWRRGLSLNTADGFQHVCWLLATSAPALNSYIYF